jgi:hypothetical protein
MLTVAWIVTGMLGGALFWLRWQIDFEDGISCPSPAGVLFIVLFAAGGPVLLAIAIIFFVINSILNQEWSDSWWTRSICRRRDKANPGA